MNSSVVFGKFFNIKSIIHKLDPRVKIIWLILFFSCIFINGGFESYLYLTAFIFSLFLLSGLPLKIIFLQWKIILFLFIFLFLLTAALSTTNPAKNFSNIPLYTIGAWSFQQSALAKSIYITWRIFLMILASIILTATTKSLYLTLALEDLLCPFKFIKLPIHEISMMMTIALRFIPTFIEESGIILKAQSSRGVDFKKGNIKVKVISMISLIIPLFLSSIQKAEDLANAMDARGYVPGQPRTRGTKLEISIIDIIFFLITVGILIIVIITSKHIISDYSWRLGWHWWGWIEPYS